MSLRKDLHNYIQLLTVNSLNTRIYFSAPPSARIPAPAADKVLPASKFKLLELHYREYKSEISLNMPFNRVVLYADSSLQFYMQYVPN